jgi:hypothetical protein
MGGGNISTTNIVVVDYKEKVGSLLILLVLLFFVEIQPNHLFYPLFLFYSLFRGVWIIDQLKKMCWVWVYISMFENKPPIIERNDWKFFTLMIIACFELHIRSTQQLLKLLQKYNNDQSKFHLNHSLVVYLKKKCCGGFMEPHNFTAICAPNLMCNFVGPIKYLWWTLAPVE